MKSVLNKQLALHQFENREDVRRRFDFVLVRLNVGFGFDSLLENDSVSTTNLVQVSFSGSVSLKLTWLHF